MTYNEDADRDAMTLSATSERRVIRPEALTEASSTVSDYTTRSAVVSKSWAVTKGLSGDTLRDTRYLFSTAD
jgi:hypothetical protein